jgi:YidC/Oxa1 family membrane protein insertase
MNWWDLIILNPLINVIVATSHYLFGSFGLTIIFFTIIIRAATFPLTLKQLRVTKAMQGIQVQMKELQQKYAKDQQRLAQEQMKLYKEAGMNPLGCILPLFTQLLVSVALYQAIIHVLAMSPEDFLNLSQRLYPAWTMNFSYVPLGNKFIWLDLATPDTLLILPIMVAASQWVMQKMTTIQTTDPAQQSQNQIMLLMMPLMFAMLTFSFPSGLALYWVASNVIGIVMQSFVTGWGALFTRGPGGGQSGGEKKIINGQVVRKDAPAKPAKALEPGSKPEGVNDGKPGIPRQDGGGRHSAGPGPTEPKPGPGGGKRPKRR